MNSHGDTERNESDARHRNSFEQNLDVEIPKQNTRNRGLSVSSVASAGKRDGRLTNELRSKPNTSEETNLLFDVDDGGDVEGVTSATTTSVNVVDKRQTIPSNGAENDGKNGGTDINQFPRSDRNSGQGSRHSRSHEDEAERSRNTMDQFDIDDYDHELDRLTGIDEFNSFNGHKKGRRLDGQWIRNAAISVLFMALWYMFSLSISVYNKWMFSAEHLDFRFPILTTSGHQLIQFLLACIILKLFGGPYRRFAAATSLDAKNNETKNKDEECGDSHGNERYQRLRGNKTNEEQDLMISDDEEEPEEDWEGGENLRRPKKKQEEEDDQLEEGHENDRWSWIKSYFRGIVPTATASGADIGLGNTSLGIVSLSFYTMVKSSSLGFVLLFGILFKLEVASWTIFAIIGVMTIGVVMMVAGEAEFSLIGFFFVLGAALFSGLRWSLTQLLLRGDQHLKRISTHNDPVKTIMYIAPPMAVFLFLWGAISEGIVSFVKAPLWKEKGFFGGVVIMMFPGLIAFLMTMSEFFLLNRTSVLTLSIAGIFKELLTLVAAALYFGDKLSTVNVIGLVTTFCAIVWYNIYRFRS